MNRPPMRLGPLAFLLTVIAIAMSVLSVLTFSTARADSALANRFARTVRTRYSLEKEAAQMIKERSDEGKGFEFTLEKDGYVLHVRLNDDGDPEIWDIHRQWDYDEFTDDLWDGN